MAFTTWTALRVSIQDAIADHVAGSPCIGIFTKGDRHLEYKSYEELIMLYEKTYKLEQMENAGDRNRITSFGRYRPA